MSWAVRFTPLAQDDVVEAYADYEAARSGLGTEFLPAVGRAVGLVSDFPEACPEVHRGPRRALAHRFPYSLYYRSWRWSSLRCARWSTSAGTRAPGTVVREA